MILGNDIPIYEEDGKRYRFDILHIHDDGGYDVEKKGYVEKGDKHFPEGCEEYIMTGYIMVSHNDYNMLDLMMSPNKNPLNGDVVAYVEGDTPDAIDEMVGIIRDINEKGVFLQSLNGKQYIMCRGFMFEISREKAEDAIENLPLMVKQNDVGVTLYFNKEPIFSSEGDNYLTVIPSYKAHKVLSYLQDNEVLCAVGYTGAMADPIYKLYAVYPLDGKMALEEIGIIDNDIENKITSLMRRNDRETIHIAINNVYPDRPAIYINAGTAFIVQRNGVDIESLISTAEGAITKFDIMKPGLGDRLKKNIEDMTENERKADKFGLLKGIIPVFIEKEPEELKRIGDKILEDLGYKDIGISIED